MISEDGDVVWPSDATPGNLRATSEKTGWKCERCGNCGMVRHAPNVDVYSVVALIDSAHSLESDHQCRLDLARVKVWLIPATPPGAADA